MTGAGKTLGVLITSVVAAACASAQPPRLQPAGYDRSMPAPRGAMPAMPTAPMAAGPARVTLSDVVAPEYRDAVLRVVGKPTLSTRAASPDVVCTPAVYEWLYDHPDRVSLAWRRLKVPCVEITELGNGKFAWSDGEGSELVWQTVGRFPDGLVWYATGKVKPGAVTPTVPVRAVVIVTHPSKPQKDGLATFSPTVQAYLQTDSRVANTLMRTLGPSAAKLAEEGAEQLLVFFNAIARYVQRNPDQADALLAPAKR
jgi:hypothetical protein